MLQHPQTYTYTVTPMAYVCHRYLHARRSWPPGSGWLLLKDDLCLTSSTQPGGTPTRPSYCWKRCFQSMASPKSFSLTMAHNLQVPSLPTSVYLGHNTQNLKSTLPTIQWIHWGMHQVHQTCTPKSQIQWCQSPACLASTPSYTHWHQASISSTAVVPMPTQKTIPAKICNNDPSTIQVHEQIDICSEAAKSQADKCSKTLVPLYAGQPVAMYDTLWRIWVPATVICILPWNSYQVCSSNGSTYCCMWRHLHECSAKAVDTAPSGTTATLQAPKRHHFSVAQPALPPPAPCMQPTSTAPATPATQMNQVPAILATPAVQKNAPAPMPQHPMPHLCSHKDPAMATWHQDAWSRKSRNYWPRLSTDLVIITCHHIHPQSILL